MQLFNNDYLQKRNWIEEKERSKQNANSEVTVRKITPEELKRFESFKPEPKRNLNWTYRD